MKLFVYTDGASRGNPGESASGYLILDTWRSPIYKHVFYNGKCTNNVAEYKAIVAALKKAAGMHAGEIDLVLTSDSKLVINQLAGNYKIKSKELKLLNNEAAILLAKFHSYELLNVPRENRYISEVDGELNAFLDRKREDKV